MDVFSFSERVPVHTMSYRQEDPEQGLSSMTVNIEAVYRQAWRATMATAGSGARQSTSSSFPGSADC